MSADREAEKRATAAARAWFERRGWTPFPFQTEVWQAMRAGRSGLLHATTGSGKTQAVWIGALLRAQQLGVAAAAGRGAPPLRVVWLTPMRALAADTARAIAEPLAELLPDWTVGLRTGDTPPAERARQDRRLPTALVTTPESLSLMLTRADARERLSGIVAVVVDEWHELIANKRGVQLQLALARLRRWNPDLVCWGLSATLGNLDEAMAALLGRDPDGQPRAGIVVHGRTPKALAVDTLLPADPGAFSWGGHLGSQMRDPVVREIESATTTLVFTNVRSQAEAWYQFLLQARPDWAGRIALHHGSLAREARDWVEAGLKAGTLKAVVATSSLDLGVDFLPVERVLQIGSAKGVARLLQRAGRSGHAPGRTSRITLVPTNTLELIEAVAARRAVAAGRIERRFAPAKPLDVLVQHLVTVALGGGFTLAADDLIAEVRACHSYRDLRDDEFGWAVDFVTRGGGSLGAYPQYHRVVPGDDGVHRVTDRGIAQRHRLQVGTIVAEASMRVKWFSGGGSGATLGQIEESFIARLKPGDHFVFAGRVLEYVRTHELAALVRRSKKTRGIVPSWAGGRMPLSSELADATLAVLGEVASHGAEGCNGDGEPRDSADPELIAAGPMLDAQRRLSRLPTAQTLLVEHHRSPEGSHLFVYPFAGRAVHIGLASLIAWRLTRDQPNSFSIGVNDHGFEILAAVDIAIDRIAAPPIFSSDSLREDVLASLMSSVLAHKRFREIARVAGLVFTGYPGAPQSARALQASSGLFYEVFRQHDPGNRLLAQADAEVLALELDLRQLDHALHRMRAMRMTPVTLSAPSPFALALMVERFREQLTTEQLADRVARIVREAEAAMGLASPTADAQALRQTLAGDAESGSAPPRRGKPAAKARPRSPGRVRR